jgi:hypothetical protein
MNRQIRRLGLVFGVLLFALLINLSFQQVFLPDGAYSVCFCRREPPDATPGV